eukprot:CAMPEP_0206555982 /NCGR_PEP_ID=MMETSP0325_2-20121206/18141_1 /ASSEMBLY_ACC=CAM_ASM_000347 /TAXON_ID=2866 /ORGANISM="Crypthecodinium cohnii, Strain Seligo" /LENGTH=61 /DNA_ID=CAMNT_0054056433 /DNA_START=378 /DNA_END=560 /DNA_ORIENTATION=+
MFLECRASASLQADVLPHLLAGKLLRGLQSVLVHAEALIEDAGVDALLADPSGELLDAMQL